MKRPANLFTNTLNLIGLTCAFTAFIVITIQVRYDLGFDNFYKDQDCLFRLELTGNDEDKSMYYYLSRPMGNLLKSSSPDIVMGTSLGIDKNFMIGPKGHPHHPILSSLLSIDKEGLELFEFDIIEGDTSTFEMPGNILVSESLAKALSPEESILGKDFSSTTNDYTVIGVYRDFPDNSFLDNGMVAFFGHRYDDNYSEVSFPLYLKLNTAGNRDRVIEDIAAKYGDFSQNGIKQTDGFKKRIYLDPIHDIHFNRNVKYDYVEKGNYATTCSLMVLSILILLIAIINFINFSMASVPLKMKSINTKKVLGCSPWILRAQQVGEAVMLASVAYLTAVLIVNILSGTTFNSLVSGSLKTINTPSFFVIGFGTSAATGIIAGIYPALYSTSFEPALVLKGSFSLSPKGKVLRSGLIAFQYAISFILIIVAFFIHIQTNYMKKYDMGFKGEHILNFYAGPTLGEKRDALTHRLKENPAIKDVTFAQGPIVSDGKMAWGRNYKGKKIQFDCFPVASNFLDFFDMKIVEGRGFSKDDDLKCCGTLIFNETAMKSYPIELNDKLSGHKDSPADIVGIVKDFNFRPLQYGIHPIALYVFGTEPWWPISYTYVKVFEESDIKAVVEYIRDVVEEMDPGFEASSYFDAKFMDESIGMLYAKEDALGKLILIACGLSVLLSIIGIFGLIYFETQFKRKEIGIRRVLGSSIGKLLRMLNYTYIKIMSISFVVAVPVSLYIIQLWLKNFTYQRSVPIWIFMAAYLMLFIISTLVISLRSLHSVCENPVHSLKSE